MKEREIKFRDFDFETKQLRYFNLDHYDKNEHDCYGNIMQYTGLKDKNGQEIYEGDIVKQMTDDWSFTDGWVKEDPRWQDKSLFNPMPQKEVMIDYVTLKSFRYWLKNESFGYEGEDLISPEDCIIIGNIYENAGLLAVAP